MELFFVVAIALAVCAVIFALMRVAAAGLRRGVAYFFLPIRPPSLIRLTSAVAAWLEEGQAAEANRQSREPPPEVIVVLRAFTDRAQGSIAPPSPT